MDIKVAATAGAVSSLADFGSRPKRMTTITSALSADHRQADKLFDAAMQAAATADWRTGQQQLGAFLEALKRHMQIEEDVLFPAFEEASGMTAGPTAVMRDEHRRMLALLDRIDAAIQARDTQALQAAAQSFGGLMAAHSAKEENVLYPMCDKLLPDGGGETLRKMLSELAPMAD